MLLFVDTNVFLSFYDYSDDDLAALSRLREYLLAAHIDILITTQIRDEFRRNRGTKIKQCLNEFEKLHFPEKLPRIAEGLEEFDELRTLLRQASEKKKALHQEIRAKAASRSLRADQIIEEIMDQSRVVEVTAAVLEKAARRVQLGNPPGKGGSLGDAINWETILANFPVGDDLHLVSRDRDFASSLDDSALHEFLQREYEDINRAHDPDVPASRITLHKSLRSFLMSVEPRLELLHELDREYDAERAEAVNELCESPSYFATHRSIANLTRFHDSFSVDEVEAMIQAARENDQVAAITGDVDVKEFFERIAQNYYDSLSRQSQETLDRMMAGEAEE